MTSDSDGPTPDFFDGLVLATCASGMLWIVLAWLIEAALW